MWTIDCANKSTEIHCKAEDTIYKGLIVDHKLSDGQVVVKCNGSAYIKKRMTKAEYLKKVFIILTIFYWIHTNCLNFV